MATPIEVISTYTDDTNKKSTSTYYVATGLTLAQILEGVRLAAVIIDAVTSAVITVVSFIQKLDLSALTSNTATSISDVEEVGAFSFTPLGQPNGSVLINVPTINYLLGVSGSDDLDTTDTDIAALVSAMEDGIAVTGGTIQPCDVDENDIVNLVYARQEVRNSGAA